MKWTKDTWRDMPSVQRRVAVEDDFHWGIAVFWQDSRESAAIDMDLPRPAIVRQPGGKRVAAVIVQAERLPDSRTKGTFDMFGAFAADGSSLVCGAGDCELVDDANREWLRLLGNPQ